MGTKQSGMKRTPSKGIRQKEIREGGGVNTFCVHHTYLKGAEKKCSRALGERRKYGKYLKGAPVFKRATKSNLRETETVIGGKQDTGA